MEGRRIGVPKLGPARDLARGLARASELKPEGEASLGPGDSQASSAQELRKHNYLLRGKKRRDAKPSKR
ncbi:hypothetical protein NDU88_008881 [Pleurodeles waltl]|uniref:Uncharacterized protein n=1 Tax=Pleurodeles waltl TaxID=8319 RepID=A0AAV7PR42_PLEWA|nr:hypothetical protein NDU88_008881 [Pleurodeles waltl]